MTQVYGGVAAEKIQSNEAVRQTSGIAIYYQGSLIDAMYRLHLRRADGGFFQRFRRVPGPLLDERVLHRGRFSARRAGSQRFR